MTGGFLTIEDNRKEQVFLFTYHTAMDIPKWVKNIPATLAKKKNYLKSKKAATDAVQYDGTIKSWFFYPNFIAAGAIASAPFSLMPSSQQYITDEIQKYGNFFHSYILKINKENKSWTLIRNHEVDEDEENIEPKEEEIYPIDLFVNSYPEAVDSEEE